MKHRWVWIYPKGVPPGRRWRQCPVCNLLSRSALPAPKYSNKQEHPLLHRRTTWEYKLGYCFVPSLSVPPCPGTKETP